MRKLKVLEVNGGEPRIIPDAPLGRGGTWTDYGEIVFAPGALGPLLSVPGAGGTRKPFTLLDQVHGEVSHLWPVALPDGVHLAFLCQNRDPTLDAIWAADIRDPGKRVRVISENSSVSFAQAENGRLRIYFLRDGALVAQELSRILQPLADPMTIAQQVDFEPLSRYGLFFSSKRNLVVFVPGTPFRYRLTWLNRSGGEIGRLAEPGDYYALRLSPDGSHLLANETEPRTGSTGVWSIDLARGTVTPVTSGSVDFFPIWSPNSSKIAFARSDGTAERGMRLSIVPAIGGEPQALLDVKGPVFPSDWSSDGSYLAYTSYRPLAQITVLSMSGETPTEVWSYAAAPHSAGGAVFRPSGRHEAPQWIAYTSDESGRNEVYVESFPGGKTKLQISASGGNSPLWRSDGRELFFLNDDEDLIAVEAPNKGEDGFGTPHRLFHMPASLPIAPPYDLNYVASSDGQRFLLRLADPKSEPAVIDMISNLHRN